MAIKWLGQDVSNIIFNGQNCVKVLFNGQVAWEKNNVKDYVKITFKNVSRNDYPNGITLSYCLYDSINSAPDTTTGEIQAATFDMSKGRIFEYSLDGQNWFTYNECNQGAWFFVTLDITSMQPQDYSIWIRRSSSDANVDNGTCYYSTTTWSYAPRSFKMCDSTYLTQVNNCDIVVEGCLNALVSSNKTTIANGINPVSTSGFEGYLDFTGVLALLNYGFYIEGYGSADIKIRVTADSLKSVDVSNLTAIYANGLASQCGSFYGCQMANGWYQNQMTHKVIDTVQIDVKTNYIDMYAFAEYLYPSYFATNDCYHDMDESTLHVSLYDWSGPGMVGQISIHRGSTVVVTNKSSFGTTENPWSNAYGIFGTADYGSYYHEPTLKTGNATLNVSFLTKDIIMDYFTQMCLTMSGSMNITIICSDGQVLAAYDYSTWTWTLTEL